MFLSRSCAGSKLFTIEKYCTEIWRVQTFSCIEICRPNWEILTFPRFRKKGLVILRREHRIMQALRFGEIVRMIQKVTSGPLAVCCTKCVRSCLHSELTICKDFIKRSSKANILAYQNISARRWQPLSNLCYKSRQATGQLATRSCPSQ